MLDIDRQVLDIANRWYLHPGSREHAVRTETGLSLTRYFQILNRLLDDPEAAVAEPELVNRLRRQRAMAARQRRAS